MQETRTETQTRGNALRIPHGMANPLKLRFVLLVHLNVTEHCKIVAVIDPAKMRAQILSKRIFAAQRARILRIGEQLDSVLLEDRLLCRKRAGFFEFPGEFASLKFAGLDIRLVECVNADDRAGNRSRDLPAEKF